MTRELQHSLVWYYCGLDKPPSRDTIDRFLTDLEHVIDDVFRRLVEQAAARGLLDSTYSIDSTHIEAIQHNDAASWNYDPTAEEYYYSFVVRLLLPAQKSQLQRSSHKRSKQIKRRRCASRVTRSPSIHRYGCSETAPTTSLTGTTLLAAGIVPVAPYNPRNTDDPLDIEYRIEDRIEQHSQDIQLKQSTLDETYNRRTGVERTNDAVKDCGLGRGRARGRVHARTEVFLSLCLRVVVAITNFERGNDPGREKLKL
ncbi:ISH11-type transposase ISHwa14 [Natrinema versiforme JCM 10478]|uniref:ISH11-type transposase ISHwa14 n=1 Tax=Natrinema versiforme JCM 10478 TaxID=1227496 RepID=L9XNL5_9EURY|nr:ISH11-type transposase ISHwa14 [Natrinema versiforme JCM 10478]